MPGQDFTFNYILHENVSAGSEQIAQKLQEAGQAGVLSAEQLQRNYDNVEKRLQNVSSAAQKLLDLQQKIGAGGGVFDTQKLAGDIEKKLVQATQLADQLQRIADIQRQMQIGGAVGQNQPFANMARLAGESFAQPGDFPTQRLNSDMLTQALDKINPSAANAEKSLKSLDVEMRSKKTDAAAAGQGVNQFGDILDMFGRRFLAWQALQLLTQGFHALVQEIGNSIDQAATYEDRLLAISNVFGSLDKGQQMLDKTRQAAFDTATSFDAMAAGEQRLLNAGQAADKVIPTLTALSAIAKANGASQEQFNQAVTAYTQIQEKGRLESEEARRQLSNRQIPALQLYAQATGQTMAQVNADMKAGKISADAFFDAINRIAMTNYGAALEASTRSLHGLETNFGNLRQLFEQTFGESAMEHAAAGFSDVFRTLQDPQVANSLSEFGNFVGNITGVGLFALNNSLQNANRVLMLLDYLHTQYPWAFNPLFFTNDQAAATLERRASAIGPGIKFDDATGAVVDYKNALDELRNTEDQLRRAEDLEQRALDDKIETLRRQNDELDKQRSLQEKLRDLARGETDLRQARMDSVNIYTSYGRSQAEKVGDLSDRVAGDRQDIMDMLFKSGNDLLIQQYQDQKTASSRTLQDTLYGMDQLIQQISQNGADFPLNGPLYTGYRNYVPGPGGGQAPGVMINPSIPGTARGPNASVLTGAGFTYTPAPAAAQDKIYPPGMIFGQTGGGSFGGPSGQWASGLTAYCPSCMSKFLLSDPRFANGVTSVVLQNSTQNGR